MLSDLDSDFDSDFWSVEPPPLLLSEDVLELLDEDEEVLLDEEDAGAGAGAAEAGAAGGGDIGGGGGGATGTTIGGGAAAAVAAAVAADLATLDATCVWVAAAVTGTGHGVDNIPLTQIDIAPDFASLYVNDLTLFLTTTLITEVGKGNDTTYILLSHGSKYVCVNTCDLASKLYNNITNNIPIHFFIMIIQM